ncbi:unnamed protein product [[Candida] boidinii]|uniref:Ribosome biogenesis protein SLX9 n=1 Tax=Candida boidinii TaxID=5477 RepID=A0A9W6T253_CANBO|nr:hypothetical protein B5S30_g227 [[Candida] boidinii]OWB85357.1 hypothetical protein B5S33_g4022 [[Candida] boidinii]GME69744.1 unnamed protein product [[Candida] boidinii]GME86709.1 unnamed protein product [[Candida] boidinii]GMF53483.1 unnamed protein product [[Candida] boidinii]
MAIKKRTTLRAKSSRSSTKGDINNKTEKAILDAAVGSDIPFLKQSRITKFEKSEIKSNIFKQKLNIIDIQKTNRKYLSDPKQPGISKSAVRRRKRKLKEQLNTKLDDLKDILDDSMNITEDNGKNNSTPFQNNGDGVSTNPFKLDHTPNPHTSLKGAKKIEKDEIRRFGLILNDTGFRENPFVSLKEAIKSNVSKY